MDSMLGRLNVMEGLVNWNNGTTERDSSLFNTSNLPRSLAKYLQIVHDSMNSPTNITNSKIFRIYKWAVPPRLLVSL